MLTQQESFVQNLKQCQPQLLTLWKAHVLHLTRKKRKIAPLLPLKAGGIAFILAAMGEQFTAIPDTTIVYPQNRQNIMHDLLSGNLKQIVIRIEAKDIHPELMGDYFDNDDLREYFQLRLNDAWHTKDQPLATLKSPNYTDNIRAC